MVRQSLYQSNMLIKSAGYCRTVSVAQCNLPALDHVGNNGLICVTDHQGEMFDSGDLFGLFKYVVDTAIDILTTSLKSYQAGNRIALYRRKWL